MERNETMYLYGHRENEKEIRIKYPYETGTFLKEKYADKYTTYDVHTAYNLRKRDVPVLIWGKKIKNENRRAFVFDRNKPKAFLL